MRRRDDRGRAPERVEHRALVEPLAGAATVVPSVVWCPSETIAPGRVRQRDDAALMVADDAAGAVLAALLEPGGARVDRVADFPVEAWRKLTVNAVAGLMAITRRRAEVFHLDGVADLALAYARECVAVARAEGAALPDGEAEAVLERLAGMPGDLGTSIMFDRLAGRPMEWDARNGVVRRLGARHGIPTPSATSSSRSSRRSTRRPPEAQAGYSSRRRIQSSPSVSSRPLDTRSSSA